MLDKLIKSKPISAKPSKSLLLLQKLITNTQSDTKIYNERPMLGTDELDKRLSHRYKGKAAKKSVSGNVNYLDHNILNLQNRTAIEESQAGSNTGLYETIDSGIKRCKSVSNVNIKDLQENKPKSQIYSQYNSARRNEEYMNIMKSHKSSKLPLKHYPDLSYDTYRKNPLENTMPVLKIEKEYQTQEPPQTERNKLVENNEDADVLQEFQETEYKNIEITQGQMCLSNQNMKNENNEENMTQNKNDNLCNDSHECVGCYNKRIIQEKEKKIQEEKLQKFTDKIKEDAEFSIKNQQILKSELDAKQSKFLLEKEAVDFSMKNAENLKRQKSEESRKIQNFQNQNFELLSKDRQKETEICKENEREKRRKIVIEQLEKINEKQKEILKEIQKKSSKTTLNDLPSFKPRNDRKLEYKKLLLDQMELDLQKRKLEKEKNKLSEGRNEIFIPHEYLTNKDNLVKKSARKNTAKIQKAELQQISLQKSVFF